MKNERRERGQILQVTNGISMFDDCDFYSTNIVNARNEMVPTSNILSRFWPLRNKVYNNIWECNKNKISMVCRLFTSDTNVPKGTNYFNAAVLNPDLKESDDIGSQYADKTIKIGFNNLKIAPNYW